MSAFIRLRQTGSRKRLVVNIDHLVSVEEGENGSEVVLTGGAAYSVEETERAIRGLIAKSGEADSE